MWHFLVVETPEVYCFRNRTSFVQPYDHEYQNTAHIQHESITYTFPLFRRTMAPLFFTFRLILYTITLLTVSFLAVVIGLIAALLGKRLNTNYYVARTFYYTAGLIMGWSFEVEGEEYLWSMKGVGGDEAVEGRAGEGGRSAVMVGNHQR